MLASHSNPTWNLSTQLHDFAYLSWATWFCLPFVSRLNRLARTRVFLDHSHCHQILSQVVRVIKNARDQNWKFNRTNWTDLTTFVENLIFLHHGHFIKSLPKIYAPRMFWLSIRKKTEDKNEKCSFLDTTPHTQCTRSTRQARVQLTMPLHQYILTRLHQQRQQFDRQKQPNNAQLASFVLQIDLVDFFLWCDYDNGNSGRCQTIRFSHKFCVW